MLLCNEFGQTNEQSSPIPTVSIFMYNEVPDYILQDEVQAQDLLSLVQAEGNDTVENYGNPEAPQQLPVLDERLDLFMLEIFLHLSRPQTLSKSKNFGKLRPDGVFIRSRKESDVFYDFIEYQDAIGVQNALKNSYIEDNLILLKINLSISNTVKWEIDSGREEKT
ncbi:hypothetical protein ZIOFF_042474 [Zingiber officinale]|uniref:Uncharacterized protein n=1 Tax=Zingiber officinale TaxID=94328 RepID=A0A8J5G1S1_ZINOF|nr:hypothetical protein ZIOFF_042474 [Zingiber officinale]